MFILLLSVFSRVNAETPSVSEPPEAEALVIVHMDTQYDDSESRLREMEQLMEFLPPTATILEKDGTTSGLAVQNYGFGPSNLPDAYGLIEKRILELNGAGSPEEMRAGRVYIPTLPMRALTEPSRYNRQNNVPILYDFCRAPAVRGAPEVSMEAFEKTAWTIDRSGRQGSSSSVLEARLTREQLEALSSKPYYQRANVTVYARMMVEFAGESGSDTGDGGEEEQAALLTGEEREAITLGLSKARGPSFVFVLDSGWPDEAAYAESRRFLLEAYDQFWEECGLSAPARSSKSPAFSPPRHCHCVEIQRALEPFEALDGSNAVEVIYVPLTRDQSSSPLLRELFEIQLFCDYQGGSEETPLPKLQRKARKEAEAMVARLSDFPPCNGCVSANSIFINSLETIGDVVSRRRGTNFVVSCSWTVRDDTLKPQDRPEPRNVLVSAVGNVPDRNVLDDRIDFAQRSLTNAAFLAVVNAGRNGELQCDSSLIDAESNFVGFDGRVSADLCATSYAAPRVSWLLALGEAARTDGACGQRWLGKLREAVRNSRGAEPFSPWLSPVEFLKAVCGI